MDAPVGEPSKWVTLIATRVLDWWDTPSATRPAATFTAESRRTCGALISRYTARMANLTISVNDETLKRARIRAIEEGVSVNQILAKRLDEYAHGPSIRIRREQAAHRFVDLSERLAGTSGGAGWSRDELYDDDRTGRRP